MSDPSNWKPGLPVKADAPSSKGSLARVFTRAWKLLQTEWGRVPLWVVLGIVTLALLALTLILNSVPLRVQIDKGQVQVVQLTTPPGPVAVCCSASSSQPQDPVYCPKGCTCAQALDGDLSTRWASRWSKDEWIALDFGKRVWIDGVVLRWEAAYGKAYTIDVSNDEIAWTSVYTETNSDGGGDEIHFPMTTTRYVRMWGLDRGTPWGYSLWEFEVYRGQVPLLMALSEACHTSPLASMSTERSGDDLLTTQAWTALNQSEYVLAITITNECINGFENVALQLQREFTESGSPPPPIGQASEEAKWEIFARGVLNNVAACYYIQGLAEENLGRIAQARSAYRSVLRFPDARAYDPKDGSFWSPAQVAAEWLAKPQGGSK
jgi:hypothetical protein